MAATFQFWRDYYRSVGEEFWRDEEGQTLVEYALLINMLALTILITMRIMSGKVTGVFNKAAAALTS